MQPCQVDSQQGVVANGTGHDDPHRVSGHGRGRPAMVACQSVVMSAVNLKA